MAAIGKLHHKIFLAYSSVSLIIICGIFVIVSIFIGKTFDRQIQQDAQAFKERIADTRDGLIEDIREKVKPETED